VENVAVNTTNTVEENTAVMFTCLFEGNPTPTVTWSLHDKILKTTDESTISLLILPSVTILVDTYVQQIISLEPRQNN
jgi:hypothetical protein